ncbi:MAG: hypothetical protein WED34_02840 [Planctomycetales bacterium]
MSKRRRTSATLAVSPVRRSPRALRILLLLLGAAATAPAAADQVRLKNGTVLEGTPAPLKGLNAEAIRQFQGPTDIYPMLLIEDGVVRYIVPQRQVAEIDREAEISRYQTFELSHKPQGRSETIKSLGRVDARSIFDDYGRRTVTLATPRGPVHVVQAITRITPRSVSVTGLTHFWDHALRTSSIDAPVLDAMIRKVTDSAAAGDRMAIATFHLQSGRYVEADRELEAIRAEFPPMAERTDEIRVKLRELWARKLLTELQHRQAAGQHRLAYEAARSFPTNKMSAGVVRQVEQIIAGYHDAADRAETTLVLLGELQARLEDPELIARVAPMRSVVRDQLGHESLARLDPFVRLADDATLSPREKLALAYSGWILGGAHAITDLDATIRLWDARFLVLEYLRSEDAGRRSELLRELAGVESADVTRVAQMVPLLPPWIETPGIQPGRPEPVVAAGEGSLPAVEYTVLLPHEYDPQHAYPLIVALRPQEFTARNEVEWWGLLRKHPDDPGVPGQSQRRGYIVIAPEWTDPKAAEHDYGAKSHYAVLHALRDAQKRFHVDADRVFLSGHGLGGDAAFDLGMSHPDLFAGVVPIAGICDGYCKWYWQNAKELPWYVVNGQLDRDTVARNARELDRMLRHGVDLIYAEYEGRGYETFYEEIHLLFDWMQRHRRRRDVKDVEVIAMRPFDNRFYWFRSEGFPAAMMQANAQVLVGEASRDRTAAPRPLKLSASIKAGNVIYVNAAGQRTTLWLNPQLVDFDQRVQVRLNGRQVFNDFLRPSLETMLEDLRLRGDRRQLFTVQLAFE